MKQSFCHSERAFGRGRIPTMSERVLHCENSIAFQT